MGDRYDGTFRKKLKMGIQKAEDGMATHSSILAWRIPWTEEPGGLRSTGVAQSCTRLKQPSKHAHRKL